MCNGQWVKWKTKLLFIKTTRGISTPWLHVMFQYHIQCISFPSINKSNNINVMAIRLMGYIICNLNKRNPSKVNQSQHASYISLHHIMNAKRRNQVKRNKEKIKKKNDNKNILSETPGLGSLRAQPLGTEIFSNHCCRIRCSCNADSSNCKLSSQSALLSLLGWDLCTLCTLLP